MRMRWLVLVSFLLFALTVPSIGCGGGTTSPVGGARAGPSVFGLPFLPAAPGQSVSVGFKNLFNTAATVYVSAFTPGGAAYNADGNPLVAGIQPLPLSVPANGELRVPLATIIPGALAGGWLYVETRDVTTPNAITGQPSAVATSGFVFPYLHRQTTGGAEEADSFGGVTGRASGVSVAVLPETDTIQILNYSFNEVAGGPVMPLAITYAVSTFNTAGTLVSTVPVLVPPNGSAQFAPAVTTGSVRIEPMPPIPAAPAPPQAQQIRYAAVARENGLQQHAEHRFFETSLGHLAAQIDHGYDVEFGTDGAGHIHDFQLLMSNTSATNQTVVLQAVYRQGGLPILTTPRAFLLGAGRTVLMRTKAADSIGLLAGETSFFEDIFGDVFTFAGFEEATLWLQVPTAVDVSARHYDRGFGAFYRVLRALPRSARPCVFDLPIQDTLSTGTRNTIVLTNTTDREMRVQVEARTPGGTLYLLDPIFVPAQSRLDWSPDGMTFTEDPTNPLLAPVSFMRFGFFPLGGIFCRGRTTVRDVAGFIRFITPTANRDN